MSAAASLAVHALAGLTGEPAFLGKDAVAGPAHSLLGELSVCRFLGKKHGLAGRDAFEQCEVDLWVDAFVAAQTNKTGMNLVALNEALRDRMFLSGAGVGLADVLVWSVLQTQAQVKSAEELVHVKRWLRSLDATPALVEAAKQFKQQQQQRAKKPAGAAATSSAGAKGGAQFGNCPILQGEPEPKAVVTRFPPEPSGHLHVGHCKAISLNEYYAKHYLGVGGGTLIVRFDDTNPAAEKAEYEEAILHDLEAMQIAPDRISHTSDYFAEIEKKAVELIKKGLAFCDFSSQDELAAQRGGKTGVRTASPCREHSIDENLRLFALMKEGKPYTVPNSKETRSVTLRAKITDKNGTPGYACGNGSMRDPVLYRVILDPPHAKTGDKFKMYATYDFACPIVDSLEGVTHVLRDSQYSDRTEQYEWLQDALNLRKCYIQQFSRVNFKRTLMSKRKLAALISEGYLEGWDDPRCPTVKGLIRRGMLVSTIKAFMLEMGGSLKQVDMEWDKIWSNNMRALDEVAPRFMAVDSQDFGRIELVNFAEHHPGAKTGEEIVAISVPMHPKNTGMGSKSVIVGPTVRVELVDFAALQVGDAVGLMGYCVVNVEAVDAAGRVAKASIIPNGDFKKCKTLVTWVAHSPLEVPVTIWEYDYILKENQEDDEEDDGGSNWRKKVNDVSKASYTVVANRGVLLLQKGAVVQFMRRGLFKLDKAFSRPGVPLEFIKVPDGKSKDMSVVKSKLEHR